MIHHAIVRVVWLIISAVLLTIEYGPVILLVWPLLVCAILAANRVLRFLIERYFF